MSDFSDNHITDNKRRRKTKATKKDVFEKIAEQLTKASGRLVKRQRGTCERMALVTNGTRSSQTEILNRNFPKFFVNGKRPNSPSLYRRPYQNSCVITLLVTVSSRQKCPAVKKLGGFLSIPL